ncbi:hypothetical protein CFOL_v3_31764 [Cephalotus follicularis]|uniref:Uncharacterized protein n=1 Tax=Cephalotus follicularis TaxID=3775 RepID=A0A1Q3D7C8_CEPFO|nr:hypothetical protein CFOL_v3_31764 [Cephalotus follicularis]
MFTLRAGFGIKKSLTGHIITRIFVCDKEGFKRPEREGAQLVVRQEMDVEHRLSDGFVIQAHIVRWSEIINSFFDGFVSSSTPLSEFLGQYAKAVSKRRADEEREDLLSMNSRARACLLTRKSEPEDLLNSAIAGFGTGALLGRLQGESSLYHLLGQSNRKEQSWVIFINSSVKTIELSEISGKS